MPGGTDRHQQQPQQQPIAACNEYRAVLGATPASAAACWRYSGSRLDQRCGMVPPRSPPAAVGAQEVPQTHPARSIRRRRPQSGPRPMVVHKPAVALGPSDRRGAGEGFRARLLSAKAIVAPVGARILAPTTSLGPGKLVTTGVRPSVDHLDVSLELDHSVAAVVELPDQAAQLNDHPALI